MEAKQNTARDKWWWQMKRRHDDTQNVGLAKYDFKTQSKIH
jgi:hypothetical protein